MLNRERRSMSLGLVACAVTLALAAPAAARTVGMPTFGAAPASNQVSGSFTFVPADAPALVLPDDVWVAAVGTAAADDDGGGGQEARPRPVAVEYSHGYQVRAKIHKYASFATLPLFAAEIALGQSLYPDQPTTVRMSNATRTWHGIIGSSIGFLFAANTFTGVWNLWDGRHDPNGRTLRLVHGLLMMAADVGFLATANAVPNRHTLNGLLNYEADKATHRDIAYASIGVATLGYTIMLFGGK
jgi:hypothetical protein